MAQNNSFLLKNYNFNFFKDVYITFVNIDNTVYCKKTVNLKNLFLLKNFNLKKINLSKKCLNIVYF